MLNKLIVATGNQGKLREIREILEGTEVLGLHDLALDVEIVEDGDTFTKNAQKKAETICELMHLPVLADDSGLEVEALNGRPGVYSARFAGEDASDADNISKLLQEMNETPDNQRQARFVCVMCLAMPDGSLHTTRGEVKGEILREMRGENGFGYDPLFYIREYEKTFAELSAEEKNAISHRGKALLRMKEVLEKLL